METITIGGRQFKAITNSTMRHDIWTQGQIERAGLTRIAIAAGESADDFAMRVFRQAAVNADVFLLLGGLLMPADKDGAAWTEAMARETADFFGGLTDEDDKRKIQTQIISMLTSFFAIGLSSLATSPNFSIGASEQPEAVATEA